MSFLDGLKNLKSKVLNEDIQSYEEKLEFCRHLDEKIRASFGNIIEEGKNFTSVILGSWNDEKEKGIRKKFDIPTEERILMQIQGDSNAFKEKEVIFVVSDKKIYFIYDKKMERLDIDSLKAYILAASNESKEISLENSEKNFSVYTKGNIISKILRNDCFMAIKTILENIQKNLSDSSEEWLSERQKLLCWLSKDFCDYPVILNITEHHILLIQSLCNDKNSLIASQAKILLIKSYLYIGNFDLVRSELESLDKNVISVKDYKETLQKAIKGFLNIIKDSNENIPTENLADVEFFSNDITENQYDFLKEEKEIFDDIKRIYFYMIIRNWPFISEETVLSNRQSYGIAEDEESIIKFVLIQRNKAMFYLFDAIKNNNIKRVDDTLYGKKDGFGLDCFHYCIMLENDSVFEQIIKLDGYYFGVLENEYSYEIEMEYLNRQEYLKKFLRTEENVQSMLEQIRLLNRKIKRNEIGKAFAEALGEMGSTVMANNSMADEDIETFENGIAASEYAAESSMATIEECKKMIYETEKEIADYSSSLNDIIRERTNSFVNSSFVIEKYLRNIYLKPELFGKILLEGNLNNFILYRCNDSWMLLHKSVIVEDDINGSSDSKFEFNQEEKIEKEYGECWFSPAAYKSLSVMKKEYIILCKKYHPDNNQYGMDVFKEIQQEKTKIIELLTK